MHFMALFIQEKSIMFSPPFSRSPIIVFLFILAIFVVSDKVKGDLVYLITELFRDWKNRRLMKMREYWRKRANNSR